MQPKRREGMRPDCESGRHVLFENCGENYFIIPAFRRVL